MKACETVIVTIRLKPGEQGLDMELPAFLPIQELCAKLLESFRSMNPTGFSGVAGLRLKHGTQVLENEDTLASRGLWDGSILEALFSGEV